MAALPAAGQVQKNPIPTALYNSPTSFLGIAILWRPSNTKGVLI